MDNIFYTKLDDLYERGTAYELEIFLGESVEDFLANGQSDEYISALNELGSFYRGGGRLGEAIDAFKRAKKAWEEKRDTKGQGYAVILNNLAGAYRMDGQNVEALSLFLDAMSVYDALAERDGYCFASLLNNIALVYAQMNELDKAIEYTRRAAEAVKGADALAFAISGVNLAALFLKADRTQEAKAALIDAEEAFLAGGYMEDAHFAAALNIDAALEVAEGNFDSALKKYGHSANIIKQFCGENNDYMTVCANIAQTHMLAGDHEKAAEHHERALDVAERLFGKHSAKYKKLMQEFPAASGAPK